MLWKYKRQYETKRAKRLRRIDNDEFSSCASYEFLKAPPNAMKLAHVRASLDRTKVSIFPSHEHFVRL